MERTHTFTHDGTEYVYRSGTIKDAEIQRILNRRLIKTLGYTNETLPELENILIYNYTLALYFLAPVKAGWWHTVGDTPDALVAGYHLFNELDSEFLKALETAVEAVKPEKKAVTKS